MHKANSEIIHTKSRIEADVDEEQMQEGFTLTKTKKVGEEARKSALEMIGSCFSHVIKGLSHIGSEQAP